MFQPDFSQLLAVLNKEKPERAVLFEFFLNEELYARLAGPVIDSIQGRHAHIRRLIHAFRNAGYDYVTVHASNYGFTHNEIHREKSHSLNDYTSITDRISFYKYTWNDPDDYDNSILDFCLEAMPQGMKVMLPGPGGVLENVIQLTGFDNLCYMVYEDPELAGMIFNEVGARLYRYYEKAIGHPAVGVMMINDDWGFNTQTMLAPAHMRKYVFPWHEALVALAHDHGKPAILHSCGFFEEVAEDVIAMGFDGKHSYEDNIMPVEQFYEKYKGRIAVLGGIDLDYVCSKPLDKVYARSRAMLERGLEGGGYALGTGNSVPYYVPQENYMTMIKAAHDLR